MSHTQQQLRTHQNSFSRLAIIFLIPIYGFVFFRRLTVPVADSLIENLYAIHLSNTL